MGSSQKKTDTVKMYFLPRACITSRIEPVTNGERLRRGTGRVFKSADGTELNFVKRSRKKNKPRMMAKDSIGIRYPTSDVRTL